MPTPPLPNSVIASEAIPAPATRRRSLAPRCGGSAGGGAGEQSPLPPQKAHTPTAAHLARVGDRLSAYVEARPAPPDPADPTRQLAPYAHRARRLGRLIATLHARSLPVDLQAAIDEALQILEEEGFFDAFDNPAPPPPPSDPEDTQRLPSRKLPNEPH